MPRLALTGGAYQARSLIASAQRSVNLYGEPVPQGEGEPMPVAHYPTPGTRLLGTLPEPIIRGMRQVTTGGLYVVAGSGLYAIVMSGTPWTGVKLGSITAGLITPVSMMDNGTTLIIVDGTGFGWTVDLATNAFAQIADPNGMFCGADRVDYLDTFFILNKPGTPQFYISGSNAVTFDSLDFANKTAYPDLLVSLAVARRELFLFGSRTTEIWYDAGASSGTDYTAFQFAEVQSVFIDHGCAAKHSVAVYDDAVYWLTADRQGQGIVMRGSGYKSERVSTFAIEAEIGRYPRIDDALGFFYQLLGHAFYVLTFPHADHTWVYDVTTGMWHEWVWIDSNGDEHRHRANCGYSVNGVPVVGDCWNGNLYALDAAVYLDNGGPIRRARAYPHLLADGKRVFYRQFLADMETGQAVQTVALPEHPIRCSFTADDGTALEDYVPAADDVGAVWTAKMPGGVVWHGGFAGTGSCAYQASGLPGLADYLVSFAVVPPRYDRVPTGQLVWAAARVGGGPSGYQVTVSADETQYNVALAVGTLDMPPVVVPMGTIPSGRFTVSLALHGGQITVQVERSDDGLFLESDGSWRADGTAQAIAITDLTYGDAGRVQIGGYWPPASPLPLDIRSFTMASPSALAAPVANSIGVDWTRGYAYLLHRDGLSRLNFATMTEDVQVGPWSSITTDGHNIASEWNSMACGPDGALYGMVDPLSNYAPIARIDTTTWRETARWGTWGSMGGGVPFMSMATFISAYGPTGALHDYYVPCGVFGYLMVFSIPDLTEPLFDTASGGWGGMGDIFNRTNCAVQGAVATGYGECWVAQAGVNWVSSITLVKIRVDVTGTSPVFTGTTYSVPCTLFDPAAVSMVAISNMVYDRSDDSLILWVTYQSPADRHVMAKWKNGALVWMVPYTAHGHFTNYQSCYGASFCDGDKIWQLPETQFELDLANSGASVTLQTAGISGGAQSFDNRTANGRLFAGIGANQYAMIYLGYGDLLALDDLAVRTEPPPPMLNQVYLEWSDDRGHSWGSPVGTTLGDLGQYVTSLQWQRLGYARDRVFRVSWSVAAPTALQGAWIDVAPAQT